MFRKLEPSTREVSILVSGQRVEVPANANLACALLAAGVQLTRVSPVSGAPRLPYCMMGVCFDCLATIDGIPNRQTCLESVREGMIVEIQDGKAQYMHEASLGDYE
ncbi:(2Fe-2S)-binding protein [Chelativorans sp. Marseille-P2723]|uniref:(2Fe-2S)-binding protein n=1 Tax=Chelativorans sp. Marseille-P2723 TaxID=2709133 RepID=UPI00156E049D|nr:(2Fe-2S)-binding protein [Chelativorans sp. Marseille-P2723]